MTDYDLIVIGAGPGGYVAALRAAQLGMKTAVVEREHLGGICLNWGCIPTKALLRSAEVLDLTREAASFGVVTSAPEPDIAAMVARSREVSGKLTGGIGYLLGKHGIDIIWGQARLAAPGKITVTAPDKAPVEPQNPPPRKVKGAGDYTARNIVIATGSRPRVLPGLEPDGSHVWTYFEAMKPSRLPGSIVVVGSGAIGIEFASFYSRLGCKVTVIEALDRLMPTEDEEIAAPVLKRLKASGVETLAGATVSGALHKGGKVALTLKAADGKTRQETAEVVISAAGVVGNIEGLGLEEQGVNTERGCIVTDAAGRSSVPGIWAIGDVAGPPMLAHKASHDGIRAVEAMAGLPVHAVASSSIPRCTYCDPQVASIGLSEEAARQAGHEVRVGRFPLSANGKALAIGAPEGLVKTIFDARTGELLGAHMVGADVTELIAAFSVGMTAEATDEALTATIFAHPTLSESLHEAVLSSMDRALHMA